MAITIKRITADLKLFNKENPKYFDILPNPDNILEIHFVLYGHEKTNFENGQYIGKIVHHPEYPRKAPDYYMITPNGRFDINKKICLTNSSFHQDDWAPAAWNLLTILEGFSSVFHSDFKEDKVGISHIPNVSPNKIKELAKDSVQYNMKNFPQYLNFPKIKANYSPYDLEI